MANPTKITFTVQDNDSETSQGGFYLGSTIDTLASIGTAAQSVMEAIAPLMTGTITEVKFSKALDTAAWTLTPAVGAATDRLVGGRFIHQSSVTPNAKKSLNLPTFDVATFVSAGSKNIDTSNPTVAAALAAIIGTTYTNSSDVELDTLVSATETYGNKSR